MDWSPTEVGTPENWPTQLATLVSTCLASPVPMALWWGQERAMFYNDCFVRLLGGEASLDMPGLPGPRGDVPWWPDLRPLFDEVWEFGRPRVGEEFPYRIGGDFSDAETLQRFHLTPVLSAGGDRVEGVLGIVSQTARIAAPREPMDARLEEKLRRAMEIETVGIIFFNTAGVITDANDAFLRMSGFTRADLAEGRIRWERLTPPEWKPHFLRAAEELNHVGRTLPYEKQYLRKDGSRWWGLYSAARLDEHEGAEFIVDISERKAADEELRRHRDELEIRVQERTAALDAVNAALREEIGERHRAEAVRHHLLRQLASAQEEERRRISRELHDEVGQHLTALMLGLKSLEAERGRPPPEALASLQAITARVGKQIHDLALELRPTSLDDLGLLRTLSNYIEEWSASSGIAVDFHSSGWDEERLPPAIETAAYRIAQEALTNIVKHARATRVSLIAERRSRQLTLIIEDDGEGFHPEFHPRHPQGGCLGLLGMEERAALVDGEVTIESSPGHGTTVFVRLPLTPRAPR